MNRIIDANLNRATEGLRVLEEIARFNLNDADISAQLKFIRHELCTFFDKSYDDLLVSRDTQNDVGTAIENPTEKNFDIKSIMRSNFKRSEQALRVLSEYAGLCDDYRYKIYTIEKQMNERLKMDIKQHLLKERNLYLVTNSDNCKSDTDFLDKVALALSSGVDIVQLREKTKPAAKIIEYAKVIRQLCSEYNVLFIVNDRIDIAQIVEADGVHLGQDDIDLKTARKILGEKMIIGISTHKPQDAILAQENGADYIGVGPVFKTPTKHGRVPVGLDYVKWAAENISIPFYAIGAINEDNIDMLTAAGAKRAAFVRAIMDSADIKNSVQNLKIKLGKK